MLAKVKTSTSGTQDNQCSKKTNKPSTAHALAIKSSAPLQAKEARGSGSSRKIKNMDIPAPLLPLFSSRCIPLIRQYLGTQTPWEEIKHLELEKLCWKAFGDELADKFPLIEGDMVWKLVHLSLSHLYARLSSIRSTC